MGLNNVERREAFVLMPLLDIIRSKASASPLSLAEQMWARRKSKVMGLIGFDYCRKGILLVLTSGGWAKLPCREVRDLVVHHDVQQIDVWRMA